MKVNLRWETVVGYEREVEIDEAQFLASGLDMASFVAENIDEICADLEEDYEGTGLTSQVESREYVSHYGYDEDEE